MGAEQTTSPLEDEAVREIIALDEAGVGDMLAVYEEIEQRYMAAASATEPADSTANYATHT